MRSASPSTLLHIRGPWRLTALLAGALVGLGASVGAVGGGGMQLQSPSFQEGEAIPRRFTCEGDDVSPALRWTDVPASAKSLVLVVDDPDAPDPAHPRTTWVHWVLYDIPPDAEGLAEAVQESGLPPGTRQGLNDWKRTGYGGPCPPVGRHRYFHKLYALDTLLGDLGSPRKAEVERRMQGHILSRAELVGTYQKGR